MPVFGVYTLTDEQLALLQQEMKTTLEGCDVQFMIDCSGSMRWTYQDTFRKETNVYNLQRFYAAETIIKALAQLVLEHDPSIEIWQISDKVGLFGSHVKSDLQTVDAIAAFMGELTPAGGTPFRQVVGKALDAFMTKLRQEREKVKPLQLIVVGDGHDGNISDLVQTAAVEIHTLTGRNPRDFLAIQVVVVTKEPSVVEAFNDWDNAASFTVEGKLYEFDVVDVTPLAQLEEMGGIASDLGLIKMMCGARSARVDDLFRELKPTAGLQPSSFEGPHPATIH
ncbi:hypothetical protein C8R46DRAFT_1114771, partial [Mycena filopes]